MDSPFEVRFDSGKTRGLSYPRQAAGRCSSDGPARSGGGEQLLARRQLDPGPLLVRTTLPLVGVDRAPAVEGDEVRIALREQPFDVVGIRIRRRPQTTGREILGEAPHSLL